MKKLMCLLVVFLISNAANAADKWEYVNLRKDYYGESSKFYFDLDYPDGKTDTWGHKNPAGFPERPKGFSKFFGALPPALANRDFTKDANVINALGFFGFEMCGIRAFTKGNTHYWFKRKIK